MQIEKGNRNATSEIAHCQHGSRFSSHSSLWIGFERFIDVWNFDWAENVIQLICYPNPIPCYLFLPPPLLLFFFYPFSSLYQIRNHLFDSFMSKGFFSLYSFVLPMPNSGDSRRRPVRWKLQRVEIDLKFLPYSMQNIPFPIPHGACWFSFSSAAIGTLTKIITISIFCFCSTLS